MVYWSGTLYFNASTGVQCLNQVRHSCRFRNVVSLPCKLHTFLRPFEMHSALLSLPHSRTPHSSLLSSSNIRTVNQPWHYWKHLPSLLSKTSWYPLFLWTLTLLAPTAEAVCLNWVSFQLQHSHRIIKERGGCL